jgi:hypothetical protein
LLLSAEAEFECPAPALEHPPASIVQQPQFIVVILGQSLDKGGAVPITLKWYIYIYIYTYIYKKEHNFSHVKNISLIQHEMFRSQ